jgi:hypothetical protein
VVVVYPDMQQIRMIESKEAESNEIPFVYYRVIVILFVGRRVDRKLCPEVGI